MNRIIGFIKKEKVLLFSLFVLILLSRLYFLGSSLWHDDAFNFVDKAITLAVDGQYFNAHSTGYPFWIIFLALVIKIGHFFTNQWSVVFLPNLITAIFGSLLLFPVYALTKKILGNIYYSLLTTAVIFVNPIIWRWSEIAMSDIFALFFIFYSIVFFIDFIEKDKNKYLWLSSLFFYLALMSRILYGLVLLSFIVFWLVSKKQFNLKKLTYIIANWFLAIMAVVFTYGLFHNFDFLIVFSGYGSAIPSFKEFLLSSVIILKSIGSIMVFMFGLGMIYLFKRNRKYFYFLLSLLIVFFCYLSTWYRNGFFDIERYSILMTVILLIIAGYCLAINKTMRILFGVSLFALLLAFINGIDLPLDKYSANGLTYAFSENHFINYAAKASQLSLQTKNDGDLLAYQNLAEYINDQDVVFYWDKDWGMPKLLLAGAHLPKKALLVSISSEEDLKEKLVEYQDKRIYLLRGAYDTYLEIMDRYKPIETAVLNDRYIVRFIPAN
ncbi:glycosyltransferase family 39 protein [Patescibacteria group bacterium]|nr:glycosyltransferase family 39 protein [Patescibacteria group bacterium]MBU4580772.1 glycosyltransferase family 39 protein [Patescibacteria group bacterium]